MQGESIIGASRLIEENSRDASACTVRPICDQDFFNRTDRFAEVFLVERTMSALVQLRVAVLINSFCNPFRKTERLEEANRGCPRRDMHQFLQSISERAAKLVTISNAEVG